MYLSKLEILGFKSFANKTIVNFTKGITGIVGPNGCGKTNIVDAIRWSLGEQKSSVLRSDKMENVIFNGTSNKKPMGMAEVSLTLINDDGTLPSEYSEITITRRIFRSGESEYLLNRNVCRLKDITSLFMDTGMGTNAYSVIELKMVETILSSKAEERRHMFEEAAGVNKYKLRRRLSLKKLEDVKADLTRVNDIVSEVDKKVKALERQAKKADKYNQFNTILREKELDLSEREFAYFSNLRAECGVKKQEFADRKGVIDGEIRELENELIVYREQTSEVETELNFKRKEVNSFTEKLLNTQKNISVAEERKKAMERNLVRYRQELEELHIQADENEESILENNDVINETKVDIDKKRIEIESNVDIIETKKNEVTAGKNEVKGKREEILTRFKDINQKENKYSNLKKSFERNNQLIEKLNAKIQDVSAHIAKTVGYLEELTNEKNEAEVKLKNAQNILTNKENEKSTLEQKLSALKESELEAKSALNNLTNKIDFLHSLISNLEGVSRGAKVLIENEEWTNKEKTLLADVGKSDDKFKFAVEAALRFVLNNLLVETVTDLKSAITLLKDNDLGKASFFLLSKSDSKKSIISRIVDSSLRRKIKKIEREPLFINWAYNLVDTKKKWKPYFQKILSFTVVTESLETALDLQKRHPDFNYATLNGDLILNNGIIDAGSLPKEDETLFGRKQQLDELIAGLPAFEEKLKKIQEAILDAEDELSVIKLKELADDCKIFENEIIGIDKQITQIEFENKKANEDVDKSRKEIQELVNETEEFEKLIATIGAELEVENQEKTAREHELHQFENLIKEKEEDYNHLITSHNQKKLEFERLRGKLQNAENAIKRAEQTRDKITETIEKRTHDISSTSEELSTIQNIIDDNQIDYDDIYEKRQELAGEEKIIDEKLKGIKGEASKFEKQLQMFRNEREQISDRLHEVDLNINKISMKLENLISHIREEYSIILELKEYEDLAYFNFEERTKEVFELKGKIKELGPINLLAYSEYEEENERLEFLMKQRNDLVDSEKDLIKTIHEINATAQELFSQTFEEIRKNFIGIFRNLFNPGDEADLKIEENVDPLEAKIEIIAKPKGKRPTSIELLSGGEKTLTATALLFAIYLVKPSPFCILDEVDAPLDDANVDRFTRLISEFSKKTQFIMVTHNKRTMEAAENMYGVTMQEEGISKLVGVQFNDELGAAS